MAVSLKNPLLITISSLFLFITTASAQLPNNTATTDSPQSCNTYVTYRVKPPYSNLGAISDLFGISRLDISTATNLASEDARLIPDQILLIPIKCTSNGTHYFSNVTYRIKKEDSFYSVSTRPFQNLTNFITVEETNPMMNPNNLTIGVEAVFPLLCKCPRKSYSESGIRYLITYVWQPSDDIHSVSTMFQSEVSDIVMENSNRNFTASICLPVFIPVKSPFLLQVFHSSPSNNKHKHHLIFLIAISSGFAALFLGFLGLGVYFYLLYKKKKTFLTQTNFNSDIILSDKDSTFGPKITQGKLLPGLSGYLDKTILYDFHVIMKSTTNFAERNKIGGSVYKAIIEDQVFAVKKTRDSSTEELQILQRVNHANLVKLMGVSSDKDGNFFVVNEYVENGSLDKWLFSTVGSLTWTQRLIIALDVANGLQYMHEHTQPSIVHKDIRTSNILLDSNFRAKISNFSAARSVSCSVMLNIDVFSFGVLVLELLSGKNVMETTTRDGESVMLWKEVKGILDGGDLIRRERLTEWMDPNLERSSYSIDDALSLAFLGRACTAEKAAERPKMAEIVFNLCVLAQSSPQMSENSSVSKFEPDEVSPVINSVIAR
ncbi:hypothetical protein ABFX02_11G108200 [Erythranthe guttata]